LRSGCERIKALVEKKKKNCLPFCPRPDPCQLPEIVQKKKKSYIEFEKMSLLK
jgi:hypothetical protein